LPFARPGGDLKERHFECGIPPASIYYVKGLVWATEQWHPFSPLDRVYTRAFKVGLLTDFSIYPRKTQAQCSRNIRPLTLYILVEEKNPQTKQNLKR